MYKERDVPSVAVGAAAACPGPGSVPGLVVAPLTPAAAVAVVAAAVELVVEEEPAEPGPAAAAVAAAAAAVGLVGPAAIVKTQRTSKCFCSRVIFAF